MTNVIKLPVINKGITLTEIPGEIAVFFEIGNCNRKCRWCHSPHLRIPLFKDLYTDLEDMLKYVRAEKARGATAVVLMGGTTNSVHPIDLIDTIDLLSTELPVGLYSGLDNCTLHRNIQFLTKLKWLKSGAYKAKYGGLNKEGSNQKFCERAADGTWVDKTYLFHENQIVPHCEEETD